MDMKRRNAYYKYIIPARYGDVAALKHLLINTNREEVVCLLAKTQTGLARDNLAMIARDNKWPGIAKLWAVEALVMSGDQRGINILLSDEMLQIIEASHSELGYSQAGWWLFDGVGKPQGYVSGSFDTPAKARAWLKEHPEAIVFPRKKISVKGGIDWSKVDWTTSPPRLKQE
jgi:hypothetical protein